MNAEIKTNYVLPVTVPIDMGNIRPKSVRLDSTNRHDLPQDVQDNVRKRLALKSCASIELVLAVAVSRIKHRSALVSINSSPPLPQARSRYFEC